MRRHSVVLSRGAGAHAGRNGTLAKKRRADPPDASGLEISVPETVQEVIGARIDRLSSSAKRPVKSPPCSGRQFRHDQLEQLLASERRGRAELEEFEHAGIVHPARPCCRGGVPLRRERTQEFAYESLLVRGARALHGRIARLARRPPDESSAERFRRCCAHHCAATSATKTIEALLRAAADAERVPSYHVARGESPRGPGTWPQAPGGGAGRRSAPPRAVGRARLRAATTSVIYASTGETERSSASRATAAAAQELDVRRRTPRSPRTRASPRSAGAHRFPARARASRALGHGAPATARAQ